MYNEEKDEVEVQIKSKKMSFNGVSAYLERSRHLCCRRFLMIASCVKVSSNRHHRVETSPAKLTLLSHRVQQKVQNGATGQRLIHTHKRVSWYVRSAVSLWR